MSMGHCEKIHLVGLPRDVTFVRIVTLHMSVALCSALNYEPKNKAVVKFQNKIDEKNEVLVKDLICLNC